MRPEWMTGSDQVLWCMQRNPTLRTPVTALSMLDRAPDVELLERRLARAAGSFPRLRQRVEVSPAGLAPPRWVDTDLDLRYHVRRLRARAPGTIATVLELAEPLAMAPFDLERPLWDLTVVEGLRGGGAALITRFHHSFSDGEGAIELAAALFDSPGSPTPVAVDDVPLPPARPAPITDAVRWRLEDAVMAVPSVVGTAAGLLRRATSPKTFATDVTETASALRRLLEPATTPLSPVMKRRGPGRRLFVFDVPMAEVRAAGRRSNSTINGVFVASVAEGLRRYHERLGAPTSALRMTMPVSIRRSGDDAAGNHFVPARFVVPLRVGGPDDRIRAANELCSQWRDDHRMLALSDTIASGLTRLPAPATTAVLASMLEGIDFVTTNVPGFADAVSIAGARVLGQYAFAPPSGAALNVALVSHGDLACIGVVADSAAVKDFTGLVSALEEGFKATVGVRAKAAAKAS